MVRVGAERSGRKQPTSELEAPTLSTNVLGGGQRRSALPASGRI
jgi:hypothetical protein